MLINWAKQTTTRAIQRALGELRRELDVMKIIIA
jgi:hypothetical protein